MERLSVIYFKILKRLVLHIIEFFIPSKVFRKNFVAWATFPKFNLVPDITKYDKTINVAFCFNDRYIPLALTAISSLLENSPGCKYDIYCVTDITKYSQTKISKYIKNRYSNGNIIFLKPNKDYDRAHCGRWPHAIWWRCMLPKLLPNSVNRIIYADVDTLLAQDSIEVPGKTVNEVLVEKIATIGENMNIRRFARFESEGLVEKYIHGDGKIAVLVNMSKGTKEVAKDVCMQIAAARPEYLNEASVPAERIEKEKEILKAQTMNEGKPEAIAEKIVEGRIGKFFGEICLVDQAFVKDPNKKVSQLLKETDSEVVEFARFEKGEGIEKKEENFAEEVMNQLKK